MRLGIATAALLAILVVLPFVIPEGSPPPQPPHHLQAAETPSPKPQLSEEVIYIRQTALATWGLVIVTLALAMATAFFMWRQVEAAKRVAQVQLFVQLTARYEGDSFRSDRRRLAGQLRAEATPDDAYAGAVLDFFETLGYLTRAQDLNGQMVFNEFSIHLLCYWTAMTPYISAIKARYSDPGLYENATWLYNEHCRLTAGAGMPTPESIKYFLKAESMS